jgi:cbb3-type cytochrome oxidase cytochrome c subunit
MPAKEDTYRNQRALHIVFALSSVAMFISITWMIVADHFREWKRLQRDFVKFDAAKTRRDSEAAKLLASKDELSKLESDLAAARQQVADTVAKGQAAIKEVRGKSQRKEQELSFLKADRDSINSFVDIEKDKGNEEGVRQLEAKLRDMDALIEKVRGESEDMLAKIAEAEKTIADANETHRVTEIEKDIANKKKEAARVDQKEWTIWSAMRSSPVLDAFSPAVKIEQLVLPDLPIHYSFKGVPRFDRCTTCHKGIDSVTKEGGPAFDDRTVANDELTTSPFRDAFRTHPHPELFAGPNSPHPRERFGCTICHLGQGSGTEFVFASHTPNDATKLKEWKEKYSWEEIHHWPWQMNRSRFVESGCVKCHPHVVDLDSPKFGSTAPKLLEGYNIVRQYGCFGCHEITGWKAGKLIGPDLRLEPQTEDERKKAVADPMNPPGRQRKVGPSLRRIAEKTPQEWTARWIKLPKGFRPTTRMPQFYGLSNNDGKLPGTSPEDLARSAAEIRAITFYLYTRSAEYMSDAARIKALSDADYQAKVQQRQTLEASLQDKSAVRSDAEKKQLLEQLEVLKYEVPLRGFQDLAEAGVPLDPSNAEQVARGRTRFIERGCLACHTHKDIQAELPQAKQDFGPDLSNVAVKLKKADGSPNTRWLFNWLKDPLVYHATSFMPNLQLQDAEAADIAAWLLSVEGSWTNDPGYAEIDEKVIDELLTLFLQKAFSLKKSHDYLTQGVPANELKDIRGDEKLLSAPISTDKKLLYLGKKTISRMGCFGCHDIPGFETAKPIGTELSSWGLKARMDPDKLDFAHIVEDLEQHPPADAHDPDFEMYAEGLAEHKGESFLWQKLRDPRSYDYDKLKAWDDKLRMPRFPFADDPKKVEAVMTFVLGLVGDDQIPPNYRNLPQTGPKFAAIEGEKALVKFNCRGCHMTKMPEITFDIAKAELTDPAGQHRDDFDTTKADQKAMTKRVQKGAANGTLSVMLVDAGPDGLERAGEIPKDADALALDVWEPAEIDGMQFFIGDRVNLTPDALALSGYKPGTGGQFAEMLVTHLMKTEKKKANAVWGFVPPPLVREGMKAQPAWLHQFLLNPTEIRPAVRLRMPRFNMTTDEAAALAGNFAAVDNMPFPYEHIHQRDSDYLAQMESQHPNYLKDAWSLLLFEPKGAVQSSQKLCAGCHRVGNKQPEGGTAEERGPNLVLTADRLRPDWLRQWLSRPGRVLPYTVMPNNFTKATEEQFSGFFKGTSREQVTGVRDALMNYHRIQQDELLGKTTAQATGGN